MLVLSGSIFPNLDMPSDPTAHIYASRQWSLRYAGPDIRLLSQACSGRQSRNNTAGDSGVFIPIAQSISAPYWLKLAPG